MLFASPRRFNGQNTKGVLTVPESWSSDITKRALFKHHSSLISLIKSGILRNLLFIKRLHFKFDEATIKGNLVVIGAGLEYTVLTNHVHQLNRDKKFKLAAIIGAFYL